FHNDMILMVQMFMAMHRDHLASVREELDKVQQLTRKLSRLQAKLGQASETAEVSLTSMGARRREESGLVAKTDRAKPEPGPRSSTPSRARKPTSREAPNRADRPDVTGRSTPAAEKSVQPRAASPPESNSVETHARLTQRIVELQRERQGY